MGSDLIEKKYKKDIDSFVLLHICNKLKRNGIWG